MNQVWLCLGLWALSNTIAAAANSAAAVPLYTDKNVPPAVYEKMLLSQDMALDMRYEEAEALLREARAEIPEHPLGGVFLLATRLSMLQESIKRGRREVPKNFFQEVDALIAQSKAQEKLYPESPYPKFYLGAALGCRGLAKLYTGHYLDSYFDGKNGVELVRQAVAIKPDLYDAYMGLGQFEYYCGSLGGLLRFVLALKGSEEKGLEMLKTCGEKATYAAWPCRLYWAKLMIRERAQFGQSASELVKVMKRYPGNVDLHQDLSLSLHNGVTQTALLEEAEETLMHLKQGLDVPAYAKVNLPDFQLDLAKCWIGHGSPEKAEPHLTELADEKMGRWREATGLLKKMKRK